MGQTSGLVKVTLTFRRRAHHCCLVSMATVTSDKRPAPALAQTVLIATATQALIMEEAGAGAKLRVLQRCADVTGKTRGGGRNVRTNRQRSPVFCLVCFGRTPDPAACRSRWRLCLTSERHTPPPTDHSGRPQHVHCQRRSCQPDGPHLRTQREP